MVRAAYNAILKAMPPFVLRFLRRCLNSNRQRPHIGEIVGVRSVRKEIDGTDPFDFVSPETFKEIYSHLPNPDVLFQMQFARQAVARDRARHLFDKGAVAHVKQQTDSVAFNTVGHNLCGAKSAPELDRPIVMTNVVTAIGRIQQNIKNVDVLSIGPRSEIELFGLRAAGFNKDRIRALDLFSYSPFIEVGDMHAMPFADFSFDVVFLGWVLAYSRDPQAAAREIVRVCRNKAIVCATADYSDPASAGSTFNKQSNHMQCCEQILGYFEGHIRKVYFQHEPELPNIHMIMTVFEISK